MPALLLLIRKTIRCKIHSILKLDLGRTFPRSIRLFFVAISITFFLAFAVHRRIFPFFASDRYVFRHLNDWSVCDRSQYPSENTLIVDRVTVLINGFSEANLPILRRITYEYSRCSSVEAIYVLWGNVSSSVELVGTRWKSAGAPVFVLRQKTDSLNDRFLPRSFIKTKSVLICDEDVSIDNSSLAFALQVWQENQQRIVGFFPWAHERNKETNEWIYRKFPDRYSIMLTKLMILRTEYLYTYTCLAPAGVKDFVDSALKCEDIAMNFLVSRETEKGPLLVNGAPRVWGDSRKSLEERNFVGMSTRVGHLTERKNCLSTLKSLFGGMYLRYNYGKAYADVAGVVLCEKFGVRIHCDSNAKSRYDARRANGQHIIQAVSRYAYMTLIGSEEYIEPAMVLAQSLRSTDTVHDMVLMVDATSLINVRNTTLSQHFSRVVKIPPVANKYEVRGFNKINAWLFEEYEKVIFLDVDIMVLTNIDHLFDHPEPAAAPDVYMSEKFNSGVIVLKPSKDTYKDMLSKLDILPSYNKGDQGFLNAYFSGWFQMPAPHRLPARYNAIFMFPTHYNPPLWLDINTIDQVIGPLAILHFAGPWYKPWQLNATDTSNVWCNIWREVASALSRNHWMPLNPDELSVRQMLPRKQDYVSFQNATLASVPRWRHQQFLTNRTNGRSETFVTVVYDVATAYGAAVWATSLKRHHSMTAWRRTMLLVSSELGNATLEPLVGLFDIVTIVGPLKEAKGVKLPPQFLVLHVWNQEKGHDRLAYVNPLSLFTDNCFDLFSFDAFAAIPSVFPPDMFSPAVMVIQPNQAMFQDMVAKLEVLPIHSVDRFLNAYFHDWFVQTASHHLPSKYGVDMWFKEGLMKFFWPWKIILFDIRAPPWANTSEWTATDRIKAATAWRQEFCLLGSEFHPERLNISCLEIR